MSVRTRRRHAFTIIEVVVTLFIIAALSLAVAANFNGGDTMASDRVAQANADAALDAMASASAVDGSPTADVARLSSETPELDFLAGGTEADEVGEVSVAVGSDWYFGAAAYAEDGACFMARVSFAADSAERTRLFAIILSGSTRVCSGNQALNLTPLGSQPTKGDSWAAPIILT